MGKKRQIQPDRNLIHIVSEEECFCAFCSHARHRGLVHGEIGEVPVVLPMLVSDAPEDMDLQGGLLVSYSGVGVTRHIPFYMDRGQLVMTDSYPLVEH